MEQKDDIITPDSHFGETLSIITNSINSKNSKTLAAQQVMPTYQQNSDQNSRHFRPISKQLMPTC